MMYTYRRTVLIYTLYRTVDAKNVSPHLMHKLLRLLQEFALYVSGGQVKDVLEYVQKLRHQGGIIEIRSPHTAGSIIRAYGAIGHIEGVWDTWNEAWKERKEMGRTRGSMIH